VTAALIDMCRYYTDWY